MSVDKCIRTHAHVCVVCCVCVCVCVRMYQQNVEEYIWLDSLMVYEDTMSQTRL